MYIKKPKDMTIKMMKDGYLLLGTIFLHKIKAESGDRNNTVDGEPRIGCNFSGSGNKPAPPIEKE